MKNSQWSIIDSQSWKKLFSSKLLWTIVCVLSTFYSFSKIPEFVTIIKEKSLAVFINTNDEVFLIQKGIIKKYNNLGVLQQTYGNKFIDDETKMININGFRCILFSPSYGKIIQLDNRLNEIDVINVFDFTNLNVTCVGSSYNNEYFWLWDAATQKLEKLDKNKKIVFESNSISALLGKSINPKYIQEQGILLYISDEENGIYIFDNQGNFIKTIPILGVKAVKVIDDKIYYVKDNCFYSYDKLSFQETKYTESPNLSNQQIGTARICGINADGFVEIWQF
ncbi:MAG: hypothetical protein KA174_01025 [Chitinophagales bacterium]|nr:hypothetical protein [Saprospirales bacterium]MBP6659225.1 hypothetical protein [Chitinophagales bacterium]